MHGVMGCRDAQAMDVNLSRAGCDNTKGRKGNSRSCSQHWGWESRGRMMQDGASVVHSDRLTGGRRDGVTDPQQLATAGWSPPSLGFHGNGVVQHISPRTISPQRSWQHGRGRCLALLKQIIKTWTKECNLPKTLNSEDASTTSGCTHQGQQQPLALFPLLTASI